jgi:hypothetical protein
MTEHQKNKSEEKQACLIPFLFLKLCPLYIKIILKLVNTFLFLAAALQKRSEYEKEFGIFCYPYLVVYINQETN